MQTYEIMVSGYGDVEEETIGFFTFDETGTLIQSVRHKGEINPSFLARAGKDVITIQERPDKAVVSIYERNAEKEGQKATLTLEGSGLCHIAYGEKTQLIVGACYESGDVFAVKKTETGELKKETQIRQSPNEQGISRAHCMTFSKDQKSVYGVNIAADCVVGYSVGEKGFIQQTHLYLPEGVGPRHLKFHPTKPIGYLITEYSNEIFVVKQDVTNGELTIIQSIGLLEVPSKESHGSTIAIHHKAQRLYAANRGADTLTHFQIEADGTLTYIKETPTYGCCPRHIALTRDCQKLLIANQESSEIIGLNVAFDTGELSTPIIKMSFKDVSFVEEW